MNAEKLAYFKSNPHADIFHFTADGLAWFGELKARDHAALTGGDVTTITRKEAEEWEAKQRNPKPVTKQETAKSKAVPKKDEPEIQGASENDSSPSSETEESEEANTSETEKVEEPGTAERELFSA